LARDAVQVPVLPTRRSSDLATSGTANPHEEGRRAAAGPSGAGPRPASCAAGCDRVAAGSPPAGSTTAAASPSPAAVPASAHRAGDRKSTRLTSSPHIISYAV